MIIGKGAEAIVELKDNFVIKTRIKKNYRVEELDNKIRKERTKLEARIMNEVRRLGINVPQIFEVGDFYIKMEFIDGKPLKEVQLNKEIIKEVAKIVARLHSKNIVHGDLTTSNFLIKENKIYLIDFGLSKFSSKIEDKAEDLLVFYYILKSLHHNFFELWKDFEKTYLEEYSEGKKVLERMKEILKRGRYILRI